MKRINMNNFNLTIPSERLVCVIHNSSSGKFVCKFKDGSDFEIDAQCLCLVGGDYHLIGCVWS